MFGFYASDLDTVGLDDFLLVCVLWYLLLCICLLMFVLLFICVDIVKLFMVVLDLMCLTLNLVYCALNGYYYFVVFWVDVILWRLAGMWD